MVRMIDLVTGKDRKKPVEEEPKEEKEKITSPEIDTRIFPRPKKQEQMIEEAPEEPENIFGPLKQRAGVFREASASRIDTQVLQRPERRERGMFVQPQREAVVLPEVEIPEISTLDEAIDLYGTGIKLLHQTSEIEAIDDTTWQKISDFIDKVVDVVRNDPKVSTDVATNYFSNFSYRYATIMNTCLLAVHTGIGLLYTREELIELGISAFLHDIGMFDLPEDVVNQTGGLSRKQWMELKNHPLYSLRKLENLPDVSDNIKMGISQAHERIDGSGYPEELVKNEIHQYAQIIGVVNMYEAITHTRPHKSKLLPYDAMKMIISFAGRSFNPKIARMFVNQVSVYPVGSLVWLNNGEIAKVVEANKNFPLRPVVAVLLGNNGHRLETPRIVNLRKNMILHVKRSADPDKVAIDAEEILNVRYEG